MAEAFYWFLNMNIVASLCASILLLLRRIPALPKRLVCWLWMIPALRLLLPFGVGGAWGSFGLVGLLGRFWGRPARISGWDHITSNYVGIAESYNPLGFREVWQNQLFTWGGRIWLLVALALLLAFTILYFTTLGALRAARPLNDFPGVYTSDKITGPALYGILRPRVIVPDGKEADPALPHILLHEETHKKRLDNLRRVLAFFLSALGWFNPLSWICLKCFLADLELACDEQVLATMGEERKKEYALALVSQAEKRSLFASAFGGAAIRLRVEHILSWKRMGWLSGIALGILALALAWFLLSNPSGGVG